MGRVGGIVLCGGRSSRMGRPKAWLPVGNELLLQRVVRVVGEAVDAVVVVAAPGQDVPPLPATVAVVRDEREGLGPLAGLATGLASLAGRADAAYLSACDLPHLTPAFVRRMTELIDEPHEPPPAVCVPEVDGFRHPLAAVYSTAVAPAVAGLLAAGRLRLSGLFDTVTTRVIAPDALPDVRSLRNVNSPGEYAAALRDLASGNAG